MKVKYEIEYADGTTEKVECDAPQITPNGIVFLELNNVQQANGQPVGRAVLIVNHQHWKTVREVKTATN